MNRAWLGRVRRTMKYYLVFLAVCAFGSLFVAGLCLLPGLWALLIPLTAMFGWCWWLAEEEP